MNVFISEATEVQARSSDHPLLHHTLQYYKSRTITTLLVLQNNIMKYTQQYFYGGKKTRKRLWTTFCRLSTLVPSLLFIWQALMQAVHRLVIQPHMNLELVITCCCGSWTKQTHPPSTQCQYGQHLLHTHATKNTYGTVHSSTRCQLLLIFFQTPYTSLTKIFKKSVLSRTQKTRLCRFEDTEEYKTGTQPVLTTSQHLVSQTWTSGHNIHGTKIKD